MWERRCRTPPSFGIVFPASKWRLLCERIVPCTLNVISIDQFQPGSRSIVEILLVEITRLISEVCDNYTNRLSTSFLLLGAILLLETVPRINCNVTVTNRMLKLKSIK